MTKRPTLDLVVTRLRVTDVEIVFIKSKISVSRRFWNYFLVNFNKGYWADIVLKRELDRCGHRPKSHKTYGE